ncbi:hypothetical protein KCU81_g7121, partial [Aureobasidium melanogenum]
MPPKGPRKRAADAEASASQAKSTKTNASATAGAASDESAQQEPDVQETQSTSQAPNNDSTDSGSDDHEMTEEKLKQDPHAYITNCLPRFEFKDRYNKKRQDDEDYDEGDGEAGRAWAKEHNEKKCPCFDKSRTDGWAMMRKAFTRKIDVETIEVPHRDPDCFGMYVYNDFAGYGYQEVVENNMAEFNKILNSKNGKTEELWTILESMPIWLLDEPNVPWHMIDDGERSWLTYGLLGFMLLAGLNRIDQEGELKPDSKYKDLSLVMSLWARVADDLGGDTDDPFDGVKGGGDSSLGDYAGFSLLWFRYLLALAKEAGIPIKGVTHIDDKVDEWLSQIEGKVKLPPKKADRFGWKTKFSKYTKSYGAGGKIGGEQFKITKWTRQERKKHAFDNEDPLTDEQIKALKDGLVLQIM